MRFSYLSIGLLALVSPLTAAWTKEDREIFRIRDELAAHDVDISTTFYDLLGITQSASLEDINKAYRQKSRSLHPDKVRQQLRSEHAKSKKKGKDGAKKPGVKATKGPSNSDINAAVKKASESQARLSLVANILRGPGRDRYDHFLANGFPLWKGTDYYYNRYRPGLGTVVIGVFLLCGGGVHYLILFMSWKRQKEFVERYIKFARETAWGGGLGIPGVDSAPAPAPEPAPQEDEEGPPQPTNRRQRRMMEKENKREDGRGSRKKSNKSRSQSQSQNASREASAAPTGPRKRVVAENGKVLVVDSVGDVFLEEEDEEGNVNEFLLDPKELAQPTYLDTAVVRVPLWAFNASVGRLFSKQSATDADAEDSDSDVQQPTPSTDSAGEDFEMLDKSTDSLTKAKTSGAQQGGKPNKRKGRKR